jgi:hypothetical protein
LGTPSDDTVTAAKLNNNIISGTTALTSEPATTDELLISDAGTLKRIDYSLISNRPYFEAYVASNQTMSDDTDTKINFDTETYDSGGMYDTTNKRFLPTVAGKYFIYFQVTYDKQGVDAWHNCHTNISKNGSTHKQYYTDFYDNYDPYAIVISGHTIMDFNGSSDYVEIFGNFNVTSGTGVVKSASQSTFGGFKLIGA